MAAANNITQQRRMGPTSVASSQATSAAATPAAVADAKRKRPEGDVPWSQPENTGTGQNIMTQVFFAIEYMKTKGVPLKFMDILSYLSLQNTATDQDKRLLRTILQRHEKVEYDATGANGEGTFSFRPPYNIRNPEQLLQKLQAQTTATGMSVKDLREGWPNVEEAINQMEAEGKLLVTRNKKDDHAKSVWANDPSLIQHFDDEFQKIWEKIKVPEPQTVKDELERAGITPTNKNKVVKPRPKVEQKKVKKPRRSGKTTHTHMMGILRDYSHLKR